MRQEVLSNKNIQNYNNGSDYYEYHRSENPYQFKNGDDGHLPAFVELHGDHAESIPLTSRMPDEEDPHGGQLHYRDESDIASILPGVGKGYGRRTEAGYPVSFAGTETTAGLAGVGAPAGTRTSALSAIRQRADRDYGVERQPSTVEPFVGMYNAPAPPPGASTSPALDQQHQPSYNQYPPPPRSNFVSPPPTVPSSSYVTLPYVTPSASFSHGAETPAYTPPVSSSNIPLTASGYPIEKGAPPPQQQRQYQQEPSSSYSQPQPYPTASPPLQPQPQQQYYVQNPKSTFSSATSSPPQQQQQYYVQNPSPPPVAPPRHYLSPAPSASVYSSQNTHTNAPPTYNTGVDEMGYRPRESAASASQYDDASFQPGQGQVAEYGADWQQRDGALHNPYDQPNQRY